MNKFVNEKFNTETKVLLLFIIYTLISGSIRKWIITDKSIGNVIFAFQLLLPFIFLITKGRFLAFKSKLITFFFLYLLIAAFNPYNLTIYHGLIGILIHFNLWYLLFYYYYNRKKIQGILIIPMLVIFCYIEIVLSYIQYGLPGDHFLNSYADLEAVGGSKASVGDSVRVTGTFSYISGYTSFLLFYSFFVWSLVKIQYKNNITLSLIFMGLIAAFMSGSRAATYTYLIFLIYIFAFEFQRKYLQSIVKTLFLPISIIFLIFYAKSNIDFGDRIFKSYENFSDRRDRNRKSGEEQQRIFWDFNQLVNTEYKYPIFGVGLGSTYQGATAIFGKSEYVKEAGYLETENTRVVLEGGFLLLLFRLILIITIIKILQFSLRDSVFLILFLIFLGGYTYNIYNAVFIFLGIVMLDQASLFQKKKNIGFKQNIHFA